MSPQPSIVLVHGAWADGSSWSGVIQRMQADGYHVTAPQFAETSLAADVARAPGDGLPSRRGDAAHHNGSTVQRLGTGMN
jgi:hypothetical protein